MLCVSCCETLWFVYSLRTIKDNWWTEFYCRRYSNSIRLAPLDIFCPIATIHFIWFLKILYCLLNGFVSPRIIITWRRIPSEVRGPSPSCSPKSVEYVHDINFLFQTNIKKGLKKFVSFLLLTRNLIFPRILERFRMVGHKWKYIWIG